MKSHQGLCFFMRDRLFFGGILPVTLVFCVLQSMSTMKKIITASLVMAAALMPVHLCANQSPNKNQAAEQFAALRSEPKNIVTVRKQTNADHAEELDWFRGALLQRIVRVNEAMRNTYSHIDGAKLDARQENGFSGSKERSQKAYRTEKNVARLRLQAFELEWIRAVLVSLDECAKNRQQENARFDQLEKPEADKVPADVLEQIPRQISPLPKGAPGRSKKSSNTDSGFDRGCPAYDYDPIEESESSTKTLLMPVRGIVSAGTWAYPSGDLHLGMDIASSMYTDVIAPADGVIVYASAPTGDGGGYLGNWIGWPYGGGNTIAMIGIADGKLYGITFCHMSSRLQVRAGQQVRQGQVIAKSGNTGNSTGPHTHVELFRLKVDFDEAASYFSRTADFSFGTGWNAPGTCSEYACRVRPEKHLQK